VVQTDREELDEIPALDIPSPTRVKLRPHPLEGPYRIVNVCSGEGEPASPRSPQLTHIFTIERSPTGHLIHIRKRLDDNTSEHVEENVPVESGFSMGPMNMIVDIDPHAEDVPAEEQGICPSRTTAVGPQEVRGAGTTWSRDGTVLISMHPPGFTDDTH
jgi:hypothetical protein